MSDRELYCDTCEGVRPFEAPPCADGHGPDCPELACTGCGAALLIATFTFPATRLATGAAHASRRASRRRAA
ncbi:MULTISPECIES: hypothetical protein [Micromonospora]|uniref:hypothetical protein n=1 Tax=Micromonospora TaxID=1873 RepID=UPI00098D6801|nr:MULTISPECIES: hypothetical protein [unclassified Micromonospora]OON28842.1 hypothetical protein BSA16_24730 [Micromonospora sp. Rc5]